MSTRDLRSCFVIMPISDPPHYLASRGQGHFKRVFDGLIHPAAGKAGFDAKLATDTAASNIIHLDVLENILNAEVVICDISSLNANVMFELGLRQAFDKPVILLKDELTNNPFDVSPLRHVKYDSSLRFDLLEEAVKSLTQSIHETIAEGGKGNSLVQLLKIKEAAALPKGGTKTVEDARFELLTKEIAGLRNQLSEFARAPTTPRVIEFPVQRGEYYFIGGPDRPQAGNAPVFFTTHRREEVSPESEGES
ncbi:MAG: hypothetical protein WA733_10585 [Methylocystis sp.]